MRTKLKLVAFLILTFFAVNSCKKFDKVITSKGGTWSLLSETIRDYYSGSLDTTYSNPYSAKYVFMDDGTGTYLNSNDSTIAITWEANEEGDSIEICQAQVGFIQCFTYFVKESEAKTQTWVCRVDLGGVDYSEVEDVFERETK